MKIDPEKLKLYLGHWVLIKDGEVLQSSEDGPGELLFYLRENKLTADALFRVPLNPYSMP